MNKTRDLILGILIIIILLIPSIACGADGDSVYSLDWTAIIVTLLGGSGLFGTVKYVLDYRLNIKKQILDSKQQEISEARLMRKEMTEQYQRMSDEVEALRKRISQLESELKKNGIPLPE